MARVPRSVLLPDLRARELVRGAARRRSVDRVRWETGIPFWAWTILPYWSIDLLYGLSLFACTTRRELDTHAKRLLTAQVVAVACFVLVPLRFTFDRPAADGLWGLMFAALAGFDQPFNQLPSLHIALAAILWALYARKLVGRRARRDGARGSC